MKIILNDINDIMVQTWRKVFNPLPDNISIECSDFRRLPNFYDKNEKLVLCTAGNSYGIMGGGLDLAIANYFSGVEEYIQSVIHDACKGELLVGQIINVPLIPQYAPFVNILYTPTMPVPMRLENASNVYYATRTALNMVEVSMNYGDVRLVLPGFGGVCGGLAPLRIARAMKLAIDRYEKPPLVYSEDGMRRNYNELAEI